MTRHAVPVLIVDDQAPFWSAARAVLAMSPGFQPVAEAESGEAAVSGATELAPELVLMDIHLPGDQRHRGSTRRILWAHPATVVILLSTYPAADLPLEARQCGAATYVHKEDFHPGVLRAVWDEHANDGSASRQ